MNQNLNSASWLSHPSYSVWSTPKPSQRVPQPFFARTNSSMKKESLVFANQPSSDSISKQHPSTQAAIGRQKSYLEQYLAPWKTCPWYRISVSASTTRNYTAGIPHPFVMRLRSWTPSCGNIAAFRGVTAGLGLETSQNGFVLIAGETALTPLGSLFDFSKALNQPFKGITHVQFRLTKLNMVDRFGQVVSGVVLKPAKRIPDRLPDTTHPCLNDQVCPGLI